MLKEATTNNKEKSVKKANKVIIDSSDNESENEEKTKSKGKGE